MIAGGPISSPLVSTNCVLHPGSQRSTSLRQKAALVSRTSTILVVHEWFASIGGSENVVDAILEAFPNSSLLCLWRDRHIGIPRARTVIESWLASTPLRGKKALSLPLMLAVWRTTNTRRQRADVVLVSSHLFAHHVATPRGSKKLVYTHTPARYIWEPEYDARGNAFLIRVASKALKPYDRWRAREAHAIAANSEFVRARVQRAWRRDAKVIYPPVEVTEIAATPEWREKLSPEDLAELNRLPSSFLLGASRFIAYKRLDQVIRAGELVGHPVVLAGGGPEEATLRERAAHSSIDVHFVERPSTELLRALYQQAAAFVFPPIEDFGIMPVEAIAAGTPVVANKIGGASESVVENRTGALFKLDDDDSLLAAVQRALQLKGTIDPRDVAKFSREQFITTMQGWIDDHMTVPAHIAVSA